MNWNFSPTLYACNSSIAVATHTHIYNLVYSKIKLWCTARPSNYKTHHGLVLCVLCTLCVRVRLCFVLLLLVVVFVYFYVLQCGLAVAVTRPHTYIHTHKVLAPFFRNTKRNVTA